MIEQGSKGHEPDVEIDSADTDKTGRDARGVSRMDTHIHEAVLYNLADGVIVVERGGAITMFNQAAGDILGIEPQAMLGNNFAEQFIVREGFDEFSELLVDAVAGEGEAEGDRQIVAVTVDGRQRSLALATSYLSRTVEDNAVPVALIAVFSDITELRELHESELRMAKAVEEQHTELQSAYRQIEERNETLATTLKKVQVARIVATVLVIGVFLGAGAYVWQPSDFSDESHLGDPAALSETYDDDTGSADGFQRMTVKPKPISEAISVVGTLSPWREVVITSPIESRVAAVHFQYGQEVMKGDLLVELDVADATQKHREARVAYLEKVKAFEAVQNWESGPEMANARRALARARMSLESQKTQLRRTAFLLEQGLAASAEHEEAERQYRGQQLDFEAAREDLKAAQARGNSAALDKVALELNTAEEEMQILAENLGKSSVYAPLSGIVLAHVSANKAPLAAGQSVKRSEALLTIGDFSRMSAKTKVDEVDIVRIRTGQAVTVTGNAFSGLMLRGIVTHVSSQPAPRSRGAPQFEVVVTLDPLEPEHLVHLRTGMSSNLRIVVYHKEEALIVPLKAVEERGASYRVRVIDPATGETQVREVEIGPTTLDSVEITAGLQPGDEIAILER